MHFLGLNILGVNVFLGVFSVIKEGPENSNIVVDFSIESLRKRMSKLMKKEMRKLKPNENMISWKTKLGSFCIGQEFEYDDMIYTSKFRKIMHFVELDKRKLGGEIDTRYFLVREEPNPECEDYEECSCGSKKKAMYEVILRDQKELRCIDCKKFHIIISKIEKKLDREKEAKKKK